MRHALVAVLLALVPCLAWGQEAAEPRSSPADFFPLPDIVPPVDPQRSDTVVPELFRIELERGASKTAAYIEPHADGMVKVVSPDGGFDWVAMYRIKRILDQDGRDVTRDVVFRRLTLGSFEGVSFRDPWAANGGKPPRVPEVWKSLRLAAAPGTACGGYLITDFAAMILRRKYYSEHYYTLDVGYARNLGRDYSLGATAFLGAVKTYREELGVRARVTTWLSHDVSLDVAPGVVLWENDDPYARFKRPGLAAQAAINVQGRVGFVVQVLSVNRRVQYGEWYYPYGPSWRDERETSVHFGLRFGGGLGIAGGAAFAVAEGLEGNHAVYVYPVYPAFRGN